MEQYSCKENIINKGNIPVIENEKIYELLRDGRTAGDTSVRL